MEIENKQLQQKINALGIKSAAAMASFLLSNLAHARLLSHNEEGAEKFCFQLDLSKTFGIQSLEHDNDNFRLFADASLLLNNAFISSDKRVKMAIENGFATLEVVGNKFSPDDLGQVMQYLNENMYSSVDNEGKRDHEKMDTKKAAIRLALEKIKDMELL